MFLYSIYYEKINVSHKIFLDVKKISKILLNMYVIIVKGYILNIKFLLHQNKILKELWNMY
jgi:hypothetical protein